MKFITRLNVDQVKKLLKDRRLSDICIIPIGDELKEILRDYLEDNTGLTSNPVMGITRIFGEEDLDNCADDLSSIIGIKQNDFILEFDMPEDMVITISYYDLLTESSNSELIPKDVIRKLKLESHTDADNEIAFVSFIDMKYCKSYKFINSEWECKDCKLNSVEDLYTLNIFGGIK